MKNLLLITSLFLTLNLKAGEIGSGCPEGTHEEIIFNDCRPSANHFCALWYSKIECVPDPMACTMDLNPWGNSSSCDCGDKYVWNEVFGICQIKREFPCTRDYNQWGFPSNCGCYEGYSYDPTVGQCKPGILQN